VIVVVIGFVLFVVCIVVVFDFGFLFELLFDEFCVLWVCRGEGFVGWGEVVWFDVGGDDCFGDA